MTRHERHAGRSVGGMRTVIAGGHGQIALRLERLLAALPLPLVEPLEEPAELLLLESEEDFDSEPPLLAAGVLLDDEPRLSVR